MSFGRKISRALISLYPNKAPGPDGFNEGFFLLLSRKSGHRSKLIWLDLTGTSLLLMSLTPLLMSPQWCLSLKKEEVIFFAATCPLVYLICGLENLI